MRWLVSVMVVSLVAGPAAAAPVVGTASLVCGGGVFTARTVHDAHMPPDDAFGYLSQEIWVRAAGGSEAKPLMAAAAPPMRLPGGQRVLTDIVQSWACLKGEGGRRYVLLDYACQRDDLGGVCAGQGEWFRILSSTGARLDEGFAPQDARYGALYARLGVVVNGVQVDDITGP